MVLAAKAFGLGKAACCWRQWLMSVIRCACAMWISARVWRCSDTVRVRPPFSAFVRRPHQIGRLVDAAGEPAAPGPP